MVTYDVREVSSGHLIGTFSDEDLALAIACDAMVSRDPTDPGAVAVVRHDGREESVILGTGGALAAQALATVPGNDVAAGR
jgi:hypothetical protein